MNEWRVAT